ncbi:hypothetical protein ZWY2020_032447 [Hordeum vulgare]|nr:hypothetical protein ZWY2020_032447 [Hordeum vulgare]
MCADPTSLAVLMVKADKYATADSAMRIKVTASNKFVPAPATPKPAGDNRGGQNNSKRKADQMANNKLVANVEGKTSASQAAPHESVAIRATPTGSPGRLSSSCSTPPARYIRGLRRLPIPFASATSHAGCRKGRACRLLRVRRRRPAHRLPIKPRSRRRRLATMAHILTTTRIKTERSSSSPVKSTTSTACAKGGAR